MVNKNNKHKSNNKNKSNNKHKSNKRKKTLKLKGGNAPSCLSSPDLTKYTNSSCNNANIHNTTPSANYDLINGEGIMPKQFGGSAFTTKEQLQPLTFIDYLKQTSDYIGGYNSNFDTSSLETEMATADGFPDGKNVQDGGSGFSINPEEMIAGLPVRSKYDSCCQPALINNKLFEGKNTGAICGSQMGGKKTHKRKNKQHLKKKKRKKTLKNKKRKLKGGQPSKFPFDGLDSDFDYNNKSKDFNAKQPNWNPNSR